MSRFLFMTAAAALALTAVRAGAEESGQPQQGLGVARKVCAECHVVEYREGLVDITAGPSFDAVANSPGITGLALSAALQSSHPNMPDLILSSEDRADVIAYILSLKRASGQQ